MKALPMSNPKEYGLYNSPPTYSEGAKKVRIIRRPEQFNDLNWKHCRDGVVLPVPAGGLYNKMQNNKEWFDAGFGFKKYKWVQDAARLDKSWDYYPFYLNPKTGRKQISIYHYHICRFDFEYIEKFVQLSLFD